VVSLAEQISCVERELGFRVRLYPRWIKAGKLAQGVADTEIERMRAVLGTLLGAQPVLPVEIAIAVEAERERVLVICGNHIHSARFVRVAEEVRRPRG
jgi:hypothetical protein